MLKYLLMKNPLVNDSSMFVAMVNKTGIKNLNDIITLMIAEGTGLTRPQALAYFEKLTQTVLYYLEEGYRISTPLFNIRPSITGLFNSKEDNFDSSRHQIKIRTTSGLRLRKFPLDIQVEKVEVNQQLPLINTFIDAASGQRNSSATPGSIGQIYGKQLQFNPSDLSQGVFFVSISNPHIVIRAMVYAHIFPKEVSFNIPDLESGDYTIKVSAASKDGKLINTGVMKDIITI